MMAVMLFSESGDITILTDTAVAHDPVAVPYPQDTIMLWKTKPPGE